jgi:hypothetical protein
VETVIYSPPLLAGASPRLQGEVILSDANGQLDQQKGLIFPVSLDEGPGCTTEPGEVQEPAR